MPHEKRLSSSEQIWHMKKKEFPTRTRNKKLPTEDPRRKANR